MEQASTAGNFGNLTIAPGALQDWCCSNLGYVNPVTGAWMRNYGHFSVGIQTTLPSSGYVATWQIFGQNAGMSCGKGCSAYQNTILPAIINPDSTTSPAVCIAAAIPEIDPTTGQQVTAAGFCGAQPAICRSGCRIRTRGPSRSTMVRWLRSRRTARRRSAPRSGH